MAERNLNDNILDDSQQRVMGLDPRVHALILGAAGTGKTRLLLAAATKYENVLVLGTSRIIAADLKRKILKQDPVSTAGSLAQTPQAFAFSLLSAVAEQLGKTQPRLLTAVLQDELLQEQITKYGFAALPEYNFADVKLRTQLRDFWQLLDEYRLEATALQELLLQSSSNFKQRWEAAANILEHATAAQAGRAEYSASGVLVAATELLETETRVQLPQLVLIDDAQNLTRGEMQLLTKLAARGTAIWAFADPDQKVTVQYGASPKLSDFIRQLPATFIMQKEQLKTQHAVLDVVHRQPHQLRELVAKLSGAVGTADGYSHRTAAAENNGGEVTATLSASGAEQASNIAFYLRSHRTGTAEHTVASWQEMAVICRSRAQALSLQQELSHRGIPCHVSGGGIVLKHHEIIRDLVLLMQKLLAGAERISADEIKRLLLGPIGGMDNTALAQLEYALRQQADLLPEYAEHNGSALLELLFKGELLLTVQPQPAAYVRLQEIARLCNRLKANSSSLLLSELLWEIWDGLFDAATLQQQALGETGTAQQLANLLLDAVQQLFYVITRNEQQEQGKTSTALLEEILSSDLPQDTLASSAIADSVIITTPHTVVGQEYKVVCIAGLQQQQWPNLKPREGLLGLDQLANILTGEPATIDARPQLAQTEMRLLMLAAARASNALHVFAEQHETTYPSIFWRYFSDYLVPTPKVNGLNLRQEVARLRSQLEKSAGADQQAAMQLAVLAAAGVRFANPNNWYGARELSGGEVAKEQLLTIGPSRLADAIACPLHATINNLKGNTKPHVAAAVGTLIHAGFEESANTAKPLAAEILQPVTENLHKLNFQFPAQAEHTLEVASQIAENISSYAIEKSNESWQVVASEIPFKFELSGVRVTGVIDRLIARKTENKLELQIVDLKTGKTKLRQLEVAADPQLTAYQIALKEGAFPSAVTATASEETVLNGANLLYVHPKLTSTFSEMSQPPISAEREEEFAKILAAVREALTGNTYTANVDSHCKAQNGTGIQTDCALHLIPAVSWQE